MLERRVGGRAARPGALLAGAGLVVLATAGCAVPRVERLEGGLYGLRVEDDQSVARAQAAAMRRAEAFCAAADGGMPQAFASGNRSWPEVSFATYELVFSCAFDTRPAPQISPEQALQALRAVSR